MKYSYKWLQKHIKEPLPTPEELKQTIIFHAFEVEEQETLGDDTVFDIKVLPDRAHDCLSHYGMARELAGLLGLTLLPYEHPPLPENSGTPLVELQTPLCRRYVAIRIDGVTVGPSPAWLKDALESVGARSINNVVDATNYVLFDRGQPVHAFDTTKIDGGIVVRMAHDDETIITLSKEEKKLSNADVVIADYLGSLAIAGVKGGLTAEVGEGTQSIVVEVANFDPVSVRKTSRKLGLVTDASKRFENELSPEVARFAAEHVASLIIELAGGAITSVTDIYPTPQSVRTITFHTDDIRRLLGGTITKEIIASALARFGYVVENKEDTFMLTVPFERYDLEGAHDIAEEIGKVVGYDSIESAPLPFTLSSSSSEYDKVRAVKRWCVAQGFREVMNYTLRKKGDVYVARGPKDKSALRTNLSDGLKESYELNRLNSALLGVPSVKLFEIGTVFQLEKEEMRVVCADGGVFEELPLDEFIAVHTVPMDLSLLPSVSGIFHIWSQYPHITRDISVWVDDEATKNLFLERATLFAKNNCVREPFLFDTFTKDGRTSLALRFVFQAADHTLTDEEVATQFTTFLSDIATLPGVTVR